MEKNVKEISVEDLFYKHADSKAVAGTAVKALRKAFGVSVLTEDQILYVDLFTLCNAKGVGRKTVQLVTEVACDLAGMR